MFNIDFEVVRMGKLEEDDREVENQLLLASKSAELEGYTYSFTLYSGLVIKIRKTMEGYFMDISDESLYLNGDTKDTLMSKDRLYYMLRKILNILKD